MNELELQQEITKYATAYYTGQSLISDFEFDDLVGRLKEINPNNPILMTPGWGYVPQGSNKCFHKYQTVGSLSKYRDINSVKSYFSNCEHPNEIFATLKLDGISCVAYYENGQLVRALTRGNGTEGQDITDKFILITGKAKLNYDISDGHFTGAIRGELLITNDNWTKLKVDYPEYKNPRNATAGIINSKFSTFDEMQDMCKYVSFVTYKIMAQHEITPPDEMIGFYDGVLNKLKRLGFDVVPNIHGSSAYDNYEDFFKLNSIYPCDGLVFTHLYINLTEDKDEKGTYVFNYNDIAYKFEDEKAETRVTHISWNMTRIGKLVPVANLEPVELDGTTVKRVTCFNAKYVYDNRIDTDAYVEIQKSGMIIPDIQRVTIESPTFKLPDRCPCCGDMLQWSGVDLVCVNTDCPSKNFNQLYRWITCNASVKSIAWSGINELIETLGFTSIDSIYELGKENALNIMENASIAYTTKQKYIEMINLLYGKINPVNFFLGFNIKAIGWKTAVGLVSRDVHNILKYWDCNAPFIDSSNTMDEAIYSVPNCGYVVREAIRKNSAYMSKIANMIEFEEPKEDTKETSTQAHYFAVTGSLNYGSRNEFCDLARQHGWEWSDVKNAEYLVTNNPDPTSSKGRKAKELGIPIITEFEFMKILSKTSGEPILVASQKKEDN